MNKFKSLANHNALFRKSSTTILGWFIPVFIAFLIEYLSGNFQLNRWLNLTENLIFGALLLSFPLLLPSKNFRRLTGNLFFFSFVFFVFFETLYFTWFGTNFSASSIFVMFETNAAEASEFITFYFNPFSIVYASFNFLYALLFWKFNCNKHILVFQLRHKLYYVLVFFGVLFFLRFTKLIDQNFPYLVARGIIEYRDEQHQLVGLSIDQKTGHFSNVFTENSVPKTFVLLIGESTTKNHLQLYGYPRENTPNLHARNDELFVFSDVVSTNAFTIEALKTALSLNNFEKDNESTIIQLFNQAGFETHWISNQRPIGPYESIVTKMSRAANYFTYTNTATAGRKTPLDEVILPHFKSALNRDAKDKFIVLHLLGTHLQYQDRYPKAFGQFKNTPPDLYAIQSEAIEKRNAYDNAVLYNDFLIDQFIQEVSKQEGEAYVLYFSDHGDEVFLSTDFAGHNDDNPSPPMLEIPFILWHSNPKEEWSNFTSRKYSTRHLIHSIADLSEIKFDEWEASKSIFSADFEEVPRIISGDRDYDEWIQVKK